MDIPATLLALSLVFPFAYAALQWWRYRRLQSIKKLGSQVQVWFELISVVSSIIVVLLYWISPSRSQDPALWHGRAFGALFDLAITAPSYEEVRLPTHVHPL